MAPEHCHQQRCHDAGHRIVDIDVSKLAGRDADLQYAAKQRHTAIDDFFAVKAREVRKIAGFRDDDLWNSARRRAGEFGPAAYQLCEQGGGGLRLADSAQQRLAALEVRHQRLRDHRLEQFFLVREVEIEGALGDAGAVRHIVEPGRGKAMLGKASQRRVEDFAGASLLAPAPALRMNSGFRCNHNYLPVSYLKLNNWL